MKNSYHKSRINNTLMLISLLINKLFFIAKIEKVVLFKFALIFLTFLSQNFLLAQCNQEYLIGDWDGDGRDNITIRIGHELYSDLNNDGILEHFHDYGTGGSLEDEYLVGDWDGDGDDDIAVRRGSEILMDWDHDGVPNVTQAYGIGNGEDEYLVGDWDGDGDDNIAVRRGNEILLNYDFDTSPNLTIAYGTGNSEDEYLVGDWNGDGYDAFAVRRGNQLLINYNFDTSPDLTIDYGLGNSEDEYLVGNWDCDNKDNFATRRGTSILIDFDFNAFRNLQNDLTIGNDCSTFTINTIFTGSAPGVPIITNSTCTTFNGTHSGGSLAAPSTTNCPTNSALQYSIDGTNFSSTLPTYNQATSITIYTRCACTDGYVVSRESQVTTHPGDCPPECTSVTPASPIITNSTCDVFNGTPSGGTLVAPSITNCPSGSTLEYSTDNINFSASLPTYNQIVPVTIYTRCHCDGTNYTSIVSEVSTAPGTCPSKCEDTEVSTLAGSGSFGDNNGTGTTASFGIPSGVTTDVSGNVYVADAGNQLIRKITPEGEVSTFAGSGASGNMDGIGTTASFATPWSLASDYSNNIYVGDIDNYLIRKITPAGVVTTIAGAGCANGTSTGPCLDPMGLATDGQGNVYVADGTNHVIRKISPSGGIIIVAGTVGVSGNINATATNARFTNPIDVATDLYGNIYVIDAGNYVIRKITSSGTVTTFAGSGIQGNDDGVGTNASFDSPQGITTDEAGNIFITDANSNLVRRITKDGVVTTIAGTGSNGNMNGIGTSASFSNPVGITLDFAGNIYVADVNNFLIRKIGNCEFCPSFTGVTPESPTITNSICTLFNGTSAGGEITMPNTTNCPSGSTLEYSTDGTNFSTTLPAYNQTTSITIYTRCSCILGDAISSISEVTTTPGDCPTTCIDASPTNPIITNSICTVPNGTPSGGLITVPNINNCPTGSVMEYSTDGTNFSTTLPTYNQTSTMTIYTRCDCNTGVVTQITTNPGLCPITCVGQVATYSTQIKLVEKHVYGSEQLGIDYTKNIQKDTFLATLNENGILMPISNTDAAITAVEAIPEQVVETVNAPNSLFKTEKKYAISNHLGNVLATVNDLKLKDGLVDEYIASVESANDYYLFGMGLFGRDVAGEYRMGFQGQEMDDEVKGDGNSVNFKYRMHDVRVGRFFAVDPLVHNYPNLSSYSFAANQPIIAIDENGAGPTYVIYSAYLSKKIKPIIERYQAGGISFDVLEKQLETISKIKFTNIDYSEALRRMLENSDIDPFYDYTNEFIQGDGGVIPSVVAGTKLSYKSNTNEKVKITLTEINEKTGLLEQEDFNITAPAGSYVTPSAPMDLSLRKIGPVGTIYLWISGDEDLTRYYDWESWFEELAYDKIKEDFPVVNGIFKINEAIQGKAYDNTGSVGRDIAPSTRVGKFIIGVYETVMPFRSGGKSPSFDKIIDKAEMSSDTIDEEENKENK